MSKQIKHKKQNPNQAEYKGLPPEHHVRILLMVAKGYNTNKKIAKKLKRTTVQVSNCSTQLSANGYLMNHSGFGKEKIRSVNWDKITNRFLKHIIMRLNEKEKEFEKELNKFNNERGKSAYNYTKELKKEICSLRKIIENTPEKFKRLFAGDIELRFLILQKEEPLEKFYDALIQEFHQAFIELNKGKIKLDTLLKESIFLFMKACFKVSLAPNQTYSLLIDILTSPKSKINSVNFEFRENYFSFKPKIKSDLYMPNTCNECDMYA